MFNSVLGVYFPGPGTAISGFFFDSKYGFCIIVIFEFGKLLRIYFPSLFIEAAILYLPGPGIS